MCAAHHFAPAKLAGDHRQPYGAENILAALFIHRQRRGQNSGMGIGQPHPFEQPLNAAVLAPAAMQAVENHIGSKIRQTRTKVGTGVDLDDFEVPLAQRRGACTSAG